MKNVLCFLKKAADEIKKNDDYLPVSAILVRKNEIVSMSCNLNESFLGHAEIQCIKIAEKKLKTKYLNDCEMFITLEPCPMCLHAIFLAKIKRVFFCAFSEHVFDKSFYRNKIEIYGGFYEDDMRRKLKNFFLKVREKKD